MKKNISVGKKDGTTEPFDFRKIVTACAKSAARVMVQFSDVQLEQMRKAVAAGVEQFGGDMIPITTMHHIVENALDQVEPRVAKSYRDYRNYKQDFVHMLDEVYQKSQSIRYIGDRDNANTDSALVPTQRSLIYNELSGELYKKFFLNQREREAMKDGYIYIHDRSARLDTMNCCLANISAILDGGFEMGNVWYNEPKTLDVAFDVISDVTIGMAACQYGGFTIPRVDTILSKYAQRSYEKYVKEYHDIAGISCSNLAAGEWAKGKVRRDFEQGFQSWEYRFNTVGSSRGDYPFIAVSFGIGQGVWEQMATEVCLEVRKNGQGKTGFKKPVLFPKLTFLYDEALHGEGGPLEHLFDCAIECSRQSMYPDFLSLTGEGYIPSMYKRYGAVVSLMGCRASLSPWYERGGMEPADDDDKPVFEGRFNLGAISLHLPMILAKARQGNRDFYEVLDEYLELIRGLHKRTYEFLGEKKASVNPLAFCEGGFYGGHLNPDDKIAPILPPMTMSFGITALNELQQLYNGKSLVEDGGFAIEVMEYINQRVAEFKQADHILYAIYGTPAESLCFVGDTEVQTYNGNKKIKDITTDDLVYSFNEALHKIELKPVLRSMKTRKSAPLVKVSFDNGQGIVCTPDHPFAVRKLSINEQGHIVGREHLEYVSASQLEHGMRIKSNYIFTNSLGRLTCSIYYRKARQLVQDINAEYFFGKKKKGYVVHHKDGDKANNKYENLEYVTDTEHRRYHMKDTTDTFCHTSESQKGSNNTFYGKTHTPDALYKNKIAHAGKKVIQYSTDGNLLNYFECAEDVKHKDYDPCSVRHACDGLANRKQLPQYDGHYYNHSVWFYSEGGLDEANHVVDSVESLDYCEDVYDIEVADNHNFFVGGNDGVLVHNCGLQVEQFRKKYGIIKGVSDRPYVSNSFHCGVWEEISPIKKQDLERRFWNLFNGGKIQYCKYPISYNVTAIKTLIRRAMKLGFYEGVNLSLAYCEECGYQELDMDVCPKCGSELVTKIQRMNGYLGFSRVHGKSRFNDAKMAEFADRVSM